MKMVIATWKNTGTTPVRLIEAQFIVRDKKEQIIGTYDYTLYAAFDSESGVEPGETYRTPKGEGFILPISNLLPNSVEIGITSASSSSGM